MIKTSTIPLTILCATLLAPGCRNDEATRVPDTRTPYMEEEAPEELREERREGEGLDEEGLDEDDERGAR